MTSKNVKNSKIKAVLGWFFGILLALFGVIALFSKAFMAFIAFGLAATLVIPPIGNWIKSRISWLNEVWGRIVILIVLIVLGIFFIGLSQEKSSPTTQVNETKTFVEQEALSEEDIINQSLTVPYRDVMRYVENYTGKTVYFERVFVMQVKQQPDGSYWFLGSQSAGLADWDDYLWIENYNGERILENDVVNVYGEVVGIKTYKTISGIENSAIVLDAQVVKRR